MIVIAELGSNPAPDWPLHPYIDAASRAGADAVKVQLFRAEHFPQDEQVDKRTVEFPREQLIEFVGFAHGYGLKAGASVFDAEAVELAAEHCDFLKIAAREQDNEDLYRAVVKVDKPIYFSLTDYKGGSFVGFNGDIYKKGHTVHLRTVSRYPAELIRSLLTLRDTASNWNVDYDGPWGWSSHTRSIWDCVLAARWGASVVEKHFMLGDGRNEPEAGWSLTPAQFAAMTARMGG